MHLCMSSRFERVIEQRVNVQMCIDRAEKGYLYLYIRYEVRLMPKRLINGIHLHYHTYGTGTPILFIHPPLLTSANFRYQAAQLSSTHQVITFDIRGHGESDASKEPITYPLIVQDMVKLLDELGIKQAYICGYSTGGAVALQALLSHPHRFKGGILVSTMAEASDYWLRGRIALAIALTAMKAKSLLAWAISFGNADSRTTYRNLKRTAMRGDVSNWKQYYQASLKHRCTEQLKSIQAPMLLIYGEKDKGFHRYAVKLQRYLPHYHLYWLKGAKHQIPTKQAREMNGIIARWVRNQELASEVKEELLAKRTVNSMPKQEAASTQSEWDGTASETNSAIAVEPPWYMEEEDLRTADALHVLTAAEAGEVDDHHADELH